MRPHSQKLKPSKADLKVSEKRSWGGKRKGFFTTVGISFCMLQLLFLAVICLLYGTKYHNQQAVHNLSVLAVDYDGGLIGQSLSQAYDQLKGDSFPTLHFESASAYPDVQSIKDIVCNGKHWAAVYAWPGASSRLSAALGGGEAASVFNPEQMITFIWLEARYPTTTEGFIQPNLNQLITTSGAALKQLNGTRALSALNQTDSAAVQAYLNPILASSINLKPSNHGSRTLYNTSTVAYGIIQMFFFVLAINGISGAMNLFSRLTVITNIIIRQGLAATYTLVAALFEATIIWAFRENWQFQSSTFALIWMVTWLHMWVNFMVIDVAACFVPMQYMSYIVTTYIVANIASSTVCIPLANVFYRYANAMPSHNWYEIFITISTNGCVNTVYRSLPILFAWFILGQLAGIPAMTYRCRNAQEAARTTQESVTATTVPKIDVKSQSSSRLSQVDTARDSLSEVSLWRQLPRATPAAVDDSVQHGRAYFPSVPVGFETVEKMISRDAQSFGSERMSR